MLHALGSKMQHHGLEGRIVVITDARVSPLYLKPIVRHLQQIGYDTHSIVVPSGERQKSLTRTRKILTEMLQAAVGRKSVVLALGGGVIGDLAGFVAAIYQRGLPLVQIPTTMLSQVDSSVGGKVAVNHPLGKNMIGAFHQPQFVWADIETLETLPFREIVCGMGEVVKYGLAIDPGLFKYLELNLENILSLKADDVLHVQSRCLEIKARIVSEDETDAGPRIILNLGHTVGHALESACDYRILKHGEAVLLGIIVESYIAKKLGLISVDVQQRILELIKRIPFKQTVESLTVDKILRAMQYDKKSVHGNVRFVLPSGIGKAKIVENVDSAVVRESLSYLRKNKL